MSPASGDPCFSVTNSHPHSQCFHSINVPSEWGPLTRKDSLYESSENVSIQLMSPASGDNTKT